MVSALGYVLYASSSLLNHVGFAGMGFAVTALVIGGALLVLSAFWHRCRKAVVSHLPAAVLTLTPRRGTSTSLPRDPSGRG